MTQREAVLEVALAIALGGLTGLLYAGFGRPAPVQTVLASDPARWGYSVAPGYQMAEGEVAAQATRLAVVQALAATPPGTPTPVWMQPSEVGGCDRLKQIAEAAMNYRCETLWASELAEPHVALGRRVEPGAQLTRIHVFGTSQGVLYYILFEQALIVWRDNDARIVVASPVNGCWLGL